MGEVVDVDFRRGHSNSLYDEFRAVRDDIVNARRWNEHQLAFERRRRREFEQPLRDERALNFPFTDEHVLDALRRVYDGAPVSATDTCRALYPAEFGHSAHVRVGLALSRLAADAKASAIPAAKAHLPMRWRPRGDA